MAPKKEACRLGSAEVDVKGLVAPMGDGLVFWESNRTHDGLDSGNADGDALEPCEIGPVRWL